MGMRQWRTSIPLAPTAISVELQSIVEILKHPALILSCMMTDLKAKIKKDDKKAKFEKAMLRLEKEEGLSKKSDGDVGILNNLKSELLNGSVDEILLGPALQEENKML